MEVSEPKLVNSILSIVIVNSLMIGIHNIKNNYKSNFLAISHYITLTLHS